ncbi:TonB-dependent receptor domain-containing protein [Brevundimonas sp.]|uniref:TonB-dependent receptor domain-containing protein n=1 Tax=Brevundimonas sp. TaxID=1871086 RepID=UPI0035B188C9
MSFNRRYLFGTTVLAGVVAFSAPAFAQEGPPIVPGDEQATELEEIVVTGSRIRRDPTNAPTPLIQISGEEVLTSGQNTVIDYLATLPALSNSVVPSDTTGSGLGDGGLDLANLRSLGSNRTLTLVDGRRHVSSSQGSLAVDVSVIPRLLIENIEIITGGASSVYGADAVSGVLNFILKDDFEGLEIDANVAQINQGGESSYRLSGLVGGNFFDDRLNLYAHAEVEHQDQVTSFDIDWLNDPSIFIPLDNDPTNAALGLADDGFLDGDYFRGLNRMDRPRWGQTTLVNRQPFSPLNDPDYANFSGSACAFTYAALCYAVNPGKTFWYEGGTARFANFGTRVGSAGVSRPYNYGGDGVNPADFSTLSRLPEIDAQRFQVGGTFAVTPNIDLYGEAKYVVEDTFDISQPNFFDIDLDESYIATQLNPIYGVQSFDLRWSDNAFLPDNVRQAIATNLLDVYSAPTATTAGQLIGQQLVPLARHSMFGPDRFQENERELTRYVVGARGSMDRLGFINNFDWDIGYTYGEVDIVNKEGAIDSRRFALAADSVFDELGVVNGNPGEIVCRAQLLQAQGFDLAGIRGAQGPAAGDPILGAQGYGQADIDQCAPLNVFGDGNQSAEALAYIDAFINVEERNEQEQWLGSVAGQLWDFWGAGPIGVALGGEFRRETTSAVGRDRDTNGRLLFLNTGPDFPEAGYESEEVFGEIAIPLFRDSFLGEFAELGASYRYADYTTVGETDVYGVNLVYRPIRDITFKTSFNTSVRVPDLFENFAPFAQTFANGFVDPCDNRQIANQSAEIRANRIANCSALAAEQGLNFDFGSETASTADDFLPTYTSGIPGVFGGSEDLVPEESESFTFSVVLQPRWVPNLSLVLDYYEIEIEDVIEFPSAAGIAANCVSGTVLNEASCDRIFRNDPTAGRDFWVGAPIGDDIGGFIQAPINYAQRTTRGLDFTATYRADLYDLIGRDWGRFDYRIAGLWLIEQENFLNTADPTDGTEISSNLFYPRVRFTSSLTYAPVESLSINWTVDWQTGQDIVNLRDFAPNSDRYDAAYRDTGGFARHDFTVRYAVNDQVSLRAGVVNAFDAEQPFFLGNTLYSNFDPFGRRFFMGVNFRPTNLGSLWPF